MNGPFPSCFEAHFESEAKLVFIHMQRKVNFHKKCFALSLAFIIRFEATRKWPIVVIRAQSHVPRRSD